MSWDEPKNLEEAVMLANTLAKSTLLAQEMQNPANVLLVLGYARSLRIAPFAALRLCQIIQGKPTLSADGLAAVVRGSSLVEKLDVIESTDERCSVLAQRTGGEPVTITWDMARAQKAGLNPGMWKKYPRQMLRARAMSEACRLCWPDVVGGVYDPDELHAPKVSLPAPQRPKAITVERSVQTEGPRLVAELEKMGYENATELLRDTAIALAAGAPLAVEHLDRAFLQLEAALDVASNPETTNA
jgi:hypothetical protein